MSRIYFLNKDITLETKSGTEFQEFHAKHPEAPLKFGCRRGECGVCAIRIIEGQQNLTKQSQQEISTLQKKKLDAATHRLACQCAFNGDVVME